MCHLLRTEDLAMTSAKQCLGRKGNALFVTMHGNLQGPHVSGCDPILGVALFWVSCWVHVYSAQQPAVMFTVYLLTYSQHFCTFLAQSVLCGQRSVSEQY
jgi:hypothetical protein